ncbi:hypothetical protein Y032_0539g3153 [Ancylostoma ceylanicum]|uniref:Uncharacterized protein n=1 Tax=Ancylostoma ceylanicum TaxID=53326 RepID=A0A016WT65_9BILA|nr:hypothetical protein Y032_0539g3153 [Ancylostoma ceylanicum]
MRFWSAVLMIFRGIPRSDDEKEPKNQAKGQIQQRQQVCTTLTTLAAVSSSNCQRNQKLVLSSDDKNRQF